MDCLTPSNTVPVPFGVSMGIHDILKAIKSGSSSEVTLAKIYGQDSSRAHNMTSGLRVDSPNWDIRSITFQAQS